MFRIGLTPERFVDSEESNSVLPGHLDFASELTGPVSEGAQPNYVGKKRLRGV